jgi:hypothetical protein
VIFLPFLGVLVYLLTQHDGMAERSARDVRQAREAYDDHVRAVAGGGSAAEIERVKALLDSGAITQEEYEALKAKALA